MAGESAGRLKPRTYGGNSDLARRKDPQKDPAGRKMKGDLQKHKRMERTALPLWRRWRRVQSKRNYEYMRSRSPRVKIAGVLKRRASQTRPRAKRSQQAWPARQTFNRSPLRKLNMSPKVKANGNKIPGAADLGWAVFIPLGERKINPRTGGPKSEIQIWDILRARL